ncbi:PREDICTED: putative F-box/FBD/LRR-repeat protein At2g05300 [Camelina sativa]|uniref:F-box/FBD/LRR-repeat protein At2g05300 n=1 Tax=Camelina sativa TaxID=90675 RepID=A0ABM0Y6N6_CAMSA|nr:PREDICTED: putative F-box/FBD/LRR-repeat protein At2g05300 [Camelina sativa]
MVDRKKSKQAPSKGLSKRLKEDGISELPDPLICHILSHLPINEAVKTSVLSSRWKSLWLWVPKLELDDYRFRDWSVLMSFGDHKHNIDDAAVKCKIQYRRVSHHCLMLQLSVTLADVTLFSFPCLKTMQLIKILYPNEATLETLISGCPVLEELKINTYGNGAKVLRVHSPSLKTLSLVRGGSLHSVSGIVIDAPLLCCLTISDDISKRFMVKNMEFNAKLDLSLFLTVDEDVDEAKRNIIYSFLTWISRVKYMTIRATTLKHIYQYSKFGRLPQFGYMTRLCVTLDAFNLKWFPIFLESCPNLKSLILGRIGVFSQLSSKKMKRVNFSSVPQWLLSSLEFVDIKSPIFGLAIEAKLVS